MENRTLQREVMISDIKDTSLTSMLHNKGKDRLIITVTVYGAFALLYLIFLHPLLTRIMRVKSFLGKLLLFLLIAGLGLYWVLDVFVYQRKLKDIRERDFGLPFKVTVIEGLSYQIVPLEVAYSDREEYARLVDALNYCHLSFSEYELKGRISLFDKSRSLYPKFEGSDLIKFLEAIYRENERRHKHSPSRRLYLLIYIPYSSDLQSVLANIVTSSRCKLQFLNEKMFKEMVEYYFCATVNLERMKANNAIKNITLDGTQLLEAFHDEQELQAFLKEYRTNRIKNSFKFELKGGHRIEKQNR